MLPAVVVVAEAASRAKYPVGEAVPTSRGDAAVPGEQALQQDNAAAATNDGSGSGRGFVRPLGQNGPGDYATMRAQGPFRGAKERTLLAWQLQSGANLRRTTKWGKAEIKRRPPTSSFSGACGKRQYMYM